MRELVSKKFTMDKNLCSKQTTGATSEQGQMPFTWEPAKNVETEKLRYEPGVKPLTSNQRLDVLTGRQ